MDSIEIPLKDRAGNVVAHATVDTADYELIAAFRWRRAVIGNNTYVVTKAEGRTTYLHRMLMKPPKGVQVDHINRDGLDNRRSNLRLATDALNRQNQRAWGRSKHRGVIWLPDRRKWRGGVTVGGVHYSTPRYDTEDEAAEAVRALRLKHMPYATD